MQGIARSHGIFTLNVMIKLPNFGLTPSGCKAAEDLAV